MMPSKAQKPGMSPTCLPGPVKTHPARPCGLPMHQRRSRRCYRYRGVIPPLPREKPRGSLYNISDADVWPCAVISYILMSGWCGGSRAIARALELRLRERARPERQAWPREHGAGRRPLYRAFSQPAWCPSRMVMENQII